MSRVFKHVAKQRAILNACRQRHAIILWGEPWFNASYIPGFSLGLRRSPGLLLCEKQESQLKFRRSPSDSTALFGIIYQNFIYLFIYFFFWNSAFEDHIIRTSVNHRRKKVSIFVSFQNFLLYSCFQGRFLVFKLHDILSFAFKTHLI